MKCVKHTIHILKCRAVGYLSFKYDEAIAAEYHNINSTYAYLS